MKTPNVKPRKLTRKQEAFIKHLVTNPKDSATEAIKHTYKTTSDNSASQLATENLRKPQIIAELEKHDLTAQTTVIEVMNQSKKKMYTKDIRAVDWASNAGKIANSVLDRLHGKATQRVESQSTVVTLNVDLTGVTDTASDIDS